MSSPPPPEVSPRIKGGSDIWFFLIAGGISSIFIFLILLMLAADCYYVRPIDFVNTLRKEEIIAAFELTMLSCTMATICAMWVATPFGYLLARYQFFGRSFIDTLVDIPIVLPPLVLGLSLLILFHVPINGWTLDGWTRETLGFPIAFNWPAVVLAQFAVSTAFAIRTMKVTFDQMDPRAEEVARTLGCSRGQAFLQIALPQAWRGMIAAATVSWARALGEFGPIMVFAGATRKKTEVLSTSVFLELSVGELRSAVAVSLFMVAISVVVLLILRLLGASPRT